MRIIKLIVAVFALFTASVVVAPATLTLQPAACQCGVPDLLTDIVTPYVEVHVYGEDGRSRGCGSGVVLEIDGTILVLTNAHVAGMCGGSNTAKLVKHSEEPGIETAWALDVEFVSQCADLAFLKPRISCGLHPAKLGDTKLVRGETCWYCGTPMGFHASIEKTIINRPTVERDGHRYTAVNGNGWYGNSGGGMYVERDGKYVLVGIVTRLVWIDARTPLLCEDQKSIAEFLKEYKEQKNAKCP